MVNSVRFCGPRRTQSRTLLFAVNRSTRLSEIKTGRVGAIGIDGRAPKTEGEESEERVFHSAKGFTFVEVSMGDVWNENERSRELDVSGTGDGEFTEESHGSYTLPKSQDHEQVSEPRPPDEMKLPRFPGDHRYMIDAIVIDTAMTLALFGSEEGAVKERVSPPSAE